ncbi:MAG: hypothetical protein U9Q72_02395 [Patescibacteria group bacterium]|nr:hypothetical protein [Patescibacteria group bacterium]
MMKLEQAPSFENNLDQEEKESFSKETKEKSFLALMEKHPTLKKTALMFSLLASTLGAAGYAQAEEDKRMNQPKRGVQLVDTMSAQEYADKQEKIAQEEKEANRDFQIVDTMAKHDAFIQSAIEKLSNKDLKDKIIKLRANLLQEPELPEDLKDFTYYSKDITEDIGTSDTYKKSFLDNTQGDIPDKGENIIFGSFNISSKQFNHLATDKVNNASSWDGFAQYDVVAPADISLETGGKILRGGDGPTKAEAIEAALSDAVAFLGTEIDSQKEYNATSTSIGNDIKIADDFSHGTETKSIQYIKNYKVVEYEEQKLEDSNHSWHKVKVEIVVGVPTEKN